MNLDNLHKKLIDVARKNPPGDHVPYAFEKRIMARLGAGSSPRIDEWAQWIRALWSSAAVCAAVAIAMGVWSSVPDEEQDLAANFSQAIEQTILPAADADSTW